jgi:DNA-binding NarL/FixJ family response regulator
MPPTNGLLLCDDLIFTSRIVGTARAAGVTIRAVKSAADLLEFARQAPPRCVIIDLHTPGLAVEEAVRELAALQPRPFLVGYGSHVDTATLKKAREAGCDIVWPRSKFVEELATALPSWFQSTEATS